MTETITILTVEDNPKYSEDDRIQPATGGV